MKCPAAGTGPGADRASERPPGPRGPRVSQLLLLGFVATACELGWVSGPTGTGAVPASAFISAGDGQEAPRGAPVPDSLEVTVVDTDGDPFEGATVRWSVAGGGGDVAGSGASDRQGRSRAAWTLGTATGQQTVHATVGELDVTLTFTATAVDPCAEPEPFALGTPVNGALEPWDCDAGGSLSDLYRFTGRQEGDQSFVLTLSSTAFAPGLVIIDELDARPVALGGAGIGGDARVRLLVDPVSADIIDYLAEVTADGAGTGDYTLTGAVVAGDVSGCEPVWLTGGTMPEQVITSADCESQDGYYSDRFLLVLTPGSEFTIIQQSSAFDAFLTLLDLDGGVVAWDDDSDVGTNARITYQAAGEGVYILDAGTYSAGATGAYTVIVTVD